MPRPRLPTVSSVIQHYLVRCTESSGSGAEPAVKDRGERVAGLTWSGGEAQLNGSESTGERQAVGSELRTA